MDEKELKQEWLKRKFLSYEYHEELLTEHEKYLQTLKRYWARPEIQHQYPDIYAKMVTPVFYNFDMISKPGEITKGAWNKEAKSGVASSISYNFNRGLGDMASEFDEYAGMPKEECEGLNLLVKKILDMSSNIRYTVDKRWDDRLDILNEEYTGPIDWPANWKEEITAALGISPASLAPTSDDARCEGGKPCPRSGFWHVWHERGSRRYFSQGQIMPPGAAGQGERIWYWDENQDA